MLTPWCRNKLYTCTLTPFIQNTIVYCVQTNDIIRRAVKRAQIAAVNETLQYVFSDETANAQNGANLTPWSQREIDGVGRQSQFRTFLLSLIWASQQLSKARQLSRWQRQTTRPQSLEDPPTYSFWSPLRQQESSGHRTACCRRSGDASL